MSLDALYILDALSTPVVVLGAEGVVIHANASTEALLGTSNKQLKGESFATWFDEQGVITLAVRGCLNGQFSSFKLVATLAKSPVSPTRNVSDALGVELVMSKSGDSLLIEIHTSSAQTVDPNESNKELLRNLAHEIKNPLGGVRGAAQLLQMELQDSVAGKGVIDKSTIEYTQVIIHEADRLQSLVDRLLAPNRQPHVKALLNIHEICERVRQLVLVEFPTGLHFVRDYDASIPEFLGDREQLIQTLLNLAHNAAQALGSRIDERTAQLTFKTRVLRQAQISQGAKRTRHKLALELLVIDNGAGIPAEIKDRIFYPLVTGRAGGSGLGLALVQNFVHQHGGEVSVQSEPGMTVFRLLLPMLMQ